MTSLFSCGCVGHRVACSSSGTLNFNSNLQEDDEGGDENNQQIHISIVLWLVMIIPGIMSYNDEV